MAAREDANPESNILAGKEKVHETTHVVAGEVRLPESGFERQRTHKVTNFDKPVKCSKSNCRLEASRRADMHGVGPKNFCSQHWAKIAPNTNTYDPDTVMLVRPEHGEDIRGEDRVVRQQTRAEAAVELFKHTGIHFPVRGPGNPRDAVDPEAEIEDHITPVIDSAVERGGRNVPATTSVDAAALMHKLKVGGAPKTQDQKLSEIGEELERNPSTKASNSFDEYEGLMGHQD
jgi:hypothetical protein